jgi:hypothetical protein
MIAMLRMLFVAVAAATLAGCATPYMVDRKRDAADIFTAAVGTGVGVKARVGPVAPGIIMHANYAGLQGGDAFWGFGRYPGFHGSDGNLLLMGGEQGNRSDVCLTRNKCHEAWYLFSLASPFSWECNPPRYGPAYFTQIEVVVGLGGSVKLGFNPGELLDFLLGWTTLDIFHDDIGLAPIRDHSRNIADQIVEDMLKASEAEKPGRHESNKAPEATR